MQVGAGALARPPDEELPASRTRAAADEVAADLPAAETRAIVGGVLKVVLLVLGLSLAAAAIVGYASRTPAEVREARPGREATDPALGATFTDEQVARHGAFRAPGYLAYALGILISLSFLLLLARGPFSGFVDRVEQIRGGWIVHAVVLAVVLTFLSALISLPLGYVRGFVVARDWGLSTQDFGGWLSDQGRALLVGAVIAAVMAVAFFGLVRWQPRSWWLWGWAAFTALTALLFFVYPVLIAPLFHRFTPLEEGSLRERAFALGEAAGVELDDVLVADASRRTTAENAYVAGLGGTKQLVLYDTLIEAGSEDETAFVIAHELGHRTRDHVPKGVAVSSAGLLVAFGALYLLSRRAELWAWGGAEGVGDLRAVPLLLVFASVATLVLSPAQAAVSRHFEREADRIAVRLTSDPDVAIRSFRRLAFSNIADLRPPGPVVWFLYSHPPVVDRIRAVQRARS